jgi:hypothetical protein
MSRKNDLRNIEVIDDATAARYRAMTPAEKIQIVVELNEAARRRAAERLTLQHPDWTRTQIQAHIAQKMLDGDEELFR